ncbi:5-formyltetrahydrofolate cyclo-ligase [Oculatella sp. LEGE 06141]|uniref:5-formyltetrahydrofolate cyclo-ligase n=1 Tax=Oculatella sp. LEGE 06141 TaxID=1828648 RepID=UPI0018807822|nr:5-formyltetrahydrofolate cyclo-ligase [Oculatella sp. LEGE 06141]MBE9181717.1 5-formyltetrahydrofolate cyclo-ligase [Oculatella sp. LEGE 06141]
MLNSAQSDWSGYYPDKDELRAAVWAVLQQHRVSLRDPVGHIPTFVGADRAAARLATLPVWQQATVIKCNPDSPHIPVRSRALQDGKRVYMAVPRLTHARCFIELNPDDLRQRQITFDDAAVARNALTCGRLVAFEEMQPIDLVTVGCVAVTRNGGRTGKGAGFADLELAILRSFDLIQPETPIVTTVHPLQIVDEARLAMHDHDWALNWIVTPDDIIETYSSYPTPAGLNWDTIRPEQYQAIPVLRQLQAQWCDRPSSRA